MMRISPLFVFTAFAIAIAPAWAQEPSVPAGNAVNGAKHFMTDGCWQCHGVSANGAALTGPRLSRTALPFDAFLHQLRAPATDMPPYESAVLSDSVAADIYTYIKGLPASPEWKDVPLLANMGR